MALPPLPELSVLMALVLVLSMYGLTVAGHFPAEHRAPWLRTAGGRLILWGTLAVCALVLLPALALAWQRIPLYAAVIGAGAMALIAPLLLQPMPDSFVDGRLGLLTFTGIALGLGLLAGRLIA